jgi:hypothetical protein
MRYHRGRQSLVDAEKIRNLNAVQGRDIGSMPLGLKAEPAVPGADIQYPSPCEFCGNRKPGIPLFQNVQPVVAFDQGSVRQLKAVIPALFGQFTLDGVL